MFENQFRHKLAAAAAAALLPLGLIACSSSEESSSGASENGTSEPSKSTLTFAAIPSEESVSLQSGFANIIKLLEQELDVKINYQDANDYAAVIEGQRAGQVDIAVYGPFSYVIAADSGVPVKPVSARADSSGNESTYTSRLHVPADSDIASIEDVKGKTVCFVDPASTSGFLVPSYGLSEAGIDPENDITPVMAGGHDASLLAMVAGNCEAAFASDKYKTVMEESGQVEKDSIQIVWESDPIPSYPIAANTETLGEEMVDSIAQILVEKGNKKGLVEAGICATEDDCTLPGDYEYGFVAARDENYDVIREICEATNADACNQVG